MLGKHSMKSRRTSDHVKVEKSRFGYLRSNFFCIFPYFFLSFNFISLLGFVCVCVCVEMGSKPIETHIVFISFTKTQSILVKIERISLHDAKNDRKEEKAFLCTFNRTRQATCFFLCMCGSIRYIPIRCRRRFVTILSPFEVNKANKKKNLKTMPYELMNTCEKNTNQTYRIDCASTDKVVTTSNSSFDCLVAVAVGFDAFVRLGAASCSAVFQRSAHFLSACTCPCAGFDEPVQKKMKNSQLIFGLKHTKIVENLYIDTFFQFFFIILHL